MVLTISIPITKAMNILELEILREEILKELSQLLKGVNMGLLLALVYRLRIQYCKL